MNSIILNLTYYAGYYTIKYTNIVSTYLIKKTFDSLFSYYSNSNTNENKDTSEIYILNTNKELKHLKERIDELEKNIEKKRKETNYIINKS